MLVLLGPRVGPTSNQEETNLNLLGLSSTVLVFSLKNPVVLNLEVPSHPDHNSPSPGSRRRRGPRRKDLTIV